MSDGPTGMPAGWTPVVPFERCFDARYGLEVLAGDPAGAVEGRVVVRPELLGPSGAVPGGLLAAAAEALASRATAFAVIPHGRAAMGLSNDTTVTGRVTEGEVRAVARALVRGDDAWVWTVEMTGADGAPCGFSRVTVAVR